MASYGALLDDGGRREERWMPAGQAAAEEEEVMGQGAEERRRRSRKALVTTVVAVGVCAVVAVLAANVFLRPSSSSSVSSLQQQRQSAATATAGKPNLLLIVLDDLSVTDLLEYDSVAVAAPTIETLAANSVRFTNYYGQPLCTPARAALLTGKHPIRLGLQSGVLSHQDAAGLNTSERLLSQVFKDNGYMTSLAGKWHLGGYDLAHLPTARGFNTFLGYLGGEETYNGHFFPHNITVEDGTQQTVLIDKLHDLMYAEAADFPEDGDDHTFRNLMELEGTYSTEFYREHAIQFLDQRNEDGEPFFLELALQNVHGPLDDIPDKYLEENVRRLVSENLNDSLLQRSALSLAAADGAIRQVLDRLVGHGMHKDTIIVITGDNGGCPYSGGFTAPFRGCKGSLWEGGVRIDGLLHWGQLHPATYDNLFAIQDWAPTLLSLMGIEDEAFTGDYIADIDGQDHSAALLELAGKDVDAIAQDKVDAAGAGSPRHTMLTPRPDGMPDRYASQELDDVVRNKLLYNILSENASRSVDHRTVVAVRVDHYKLVREYHEGYYWNSSSVMDGTFVSTSTDCSAPGTGQDQVLRSLVYDLSRDPYETNATDFADFELMHPKVATQMQGVLNTGAQNMVDSVLLHKATPNDDGFIAMVEDSEGWLRPWL